MKIMNFFFFYKHRYLIAVILGKPGAQAYITHNMQQAVLASKKKTKPKSLKSIFKKHQKRAFVLNHSITPAHNSL